MGYPISSNIPGPYRSVRQLALLAETIWCRLAESPNANVSVANSYSRGDRELEKATAMLFPSEIAQRGRMRDHTAAQFRRRVSV